MNFVYQNQELLDIEIDTGLDLETATEKKIIMVKPDTTTVELTATSIGTKLIFSNPPLENTFDQYGVYEFQGTFILDGRKAFTKINVQLFKKTL